MTAPARVAAALAVLALLLLGPLGAGGAAARAMGPLPPCRYDDILTSPRGYGDWSETLVDTILRVPNSYAPPDLVSTTTAGLPGTGRAVRAVAVDDLRAMAAAADAAGAAIGVESAYRSYADQQALYEAWTPGANGDSSEAPARPGHSEHQLGLAIDFHSAAPDAKPGQERFVNTPGGKWMAEHAWEFGWVMSYPEAEDEHTCYAFEPWHYRYVGRPQAARVHASGMTLREFLWAGSTTTVVPMPIPSGLVAIPTTAPAAPTAGASASPTATPATTATAGTGTSSPAPAPSETGSPAPAEPPLTGAGSIDAGQAVVFGAIAISAASLVGIWMAMRRTRPGPPDGAA